MRIRRVVLLFGIVNACLYSALLPLWEGFDEPYHYACVESIWESRRLPALGRTFLTGDVFRSFEFAPLSYLVHEATGQGTSYEEWFPLPQQEKDEEPLAEDLAATLAFRLQRLEAIRAAAEALMNRPRLGRDIFVRGQPEGVEISRRPQWQASLHDLLSAYARQRQKRAASRVQLKPRFAWSLVEARAALEKLIGEALDWTVLDSFLIMYVTTPEARRAVKASSLAAALEMVRQGAISLRQDRAYAPLWLKKRDETVRPTSPQEGS